MMVAEEDFVIVADETCQDVYADNDEFNDYFANVEVFIKNWKLIFRPICASLESESTLNGLKRRVSSPENWNSFEVG